MGMAGQEPPLELQVDERVVGATSPSKVFFSTRGKTELDLVRYHLSLGEGVLRGVHRRPTVLKRCPNGAEGEFFFQKRLPRPRPDWPESVAVPSPSGRKAEELCPTVLAHIGWVVDLGCLDLNPWPVRREDFEHPDALRVDLDPQPGLSFGQVRRVALEVQSVLEEHRLYGHPKTSGSRGIHVNLPIGTRRESTAFRRVGLAIAREVERRLPGIATSTWRKQERGDAVFVDCSQNARDRAVASAYGLRVDPAGRASCPAECSELKEVEPAGLTIATVPGIFSERGDPSASIDDVSHSVESRLELARKAERDGPGEAPWPPHFAKRKGEAGRVRPSRRSTT